MSTQGLTLKAGTLDNSGQGTLSSQAAINLLVGRLNNRDGGLILGTTRTDIAARDIDNTAGRLQSAGQLTLTKVASLDNRQGRILPTAISTSMPTSHRPIRRWRCSTRAGAWKVRLT